MKSQLNYRFGIKVATPTFLGQKDNSEIIIYEILIHFLTPCNKCDILSLSKYVITILRESYLYNSILT